MILKFSFIFLITIIKLNLFTKRLYSKGMDAVSRFVMTYLSGNKKKNKSSWKENNCHEHKCKTFHT